MKKFKSFKKDLINRVKIFTKGESAPNLEKVKNEKDLFKYLYRCINFYFYINKIITKQDLLKFNKKLLLSKGFYIDFFDDIDTNKAYITLIDSSPVITIDDKSKIDWMSIEGNSKPIIYITKSEPVSLQICGNASPSIIFSYNTTSLITIYQKAKPKLELNKFSNAKIFVYDKSAPIINVNNVSVCSLTGESTTKPTVTINDTSILILDMYVHNKNVKIINNSTVINRAQNIIQKLK